MEKQMKLFDPDNYQGLNGCCQINVCADVSTEDSASEATHEGVSLVQYNDAEPSLLCNTCGKYKNNVAEQCPMCGEIE